LNLAKYRVKEGCAEKLKGQITALRENLEEANYKGNMTKMYQTVRSLTQKSQPQLHYTESKTGEMVTEPMQIAACWKEYCRKLFEDNNSVNLPQSVHVQ